MTALRLSGKSLDRRREGGVIASALKWVLAAVVAIPIAVLAHEAGHVLAYRAARLRWCPGSITSG